MHPPHSPSPSPRYPGDVLGEEFLASGEASTETVTVQTPSVTLSLTRDAYMSALASRIVSSPHGNVAQDEERRRHAYGGGAYGGGVYGGSVRALLAFEPLAIVGEGASAKVAIVRDTARGQVFALKKMARKKITGRQARRQILDERFLMGDVDHPFIAKLHGSFKSYDSLFLLVEPCLGGEPTLSLTNRPLPLPHQAPSPSPSPTALINHLHSPILANRPHFHPRLNVLILTGELFERMKRLRSLPQDSARFYTACVVSALDHMHTRSIIYRDLKPENLMLASNGYVKLVDFGLAKRLSGRAYTLCGTPEYLAPEMITLSGHGKGVDWWALGVLLYEMLVGAAPWTIDPETRDATAARTQRILRRA